jgi:hypothetical protein
MWRRITIPKIESYGAFAQQVWAVLKLIIPAGTFAMIMSVLAAISDVLTAYAPFSWAVAGLLCALIASIGLAILGYFRLRSAEASLLHARAMPPTTVNPLEALFQGKCINLDDFRHPYLPAMYERKKFVDCELYGPAIVMLLNDNYISPMQVIHSILSTSAYHQLYLMVLDSVGHKSLIVRSTTSRSISVVLGSPR